MARPKKDLKGKGRAADANQDAAGEAAAGPFPTAEKESARFFLDSTDDVSLARLERKIAYWIVRERQDAIAGTADRLVQWLESIPQDAMQAAISGGLISKIIDGIFKVMSLDAKGRDSLLVRINNRNVPIDRVDVFGKLAPDAVNMAAATMALQQSAEKMTVSESAEAAVTDGDSTSDAEPAIEGASNSAVAPANEHSSGAAVAHELQAMLADGIAIFDDDFVLEKD
ncbi:hypothetical protein NCC49_000690 [Naganishia albida]|nr:hypothetical protein NCC49_000690 [Naganishia albida]